MWIFCPCSQVNQSNYFWTFDFYGKSLRRSCHQVRFKLEYWELSEFCSFVPLHSGSVWKVIQNYGESYCWFWIFNVTFVNHYMNSWKLEIGKEFLQWICNVTVVAWQQKKYKKRWFEMNFTIWIWSLWSRSKS